MATYQHFHPGEVQLHEQWGTDTAAYEAQSHQMMLPDVNPNEHVFIDSLTFSMAGSVDRDGRPWASPLFSTGGRLFTVESSRRVRIEPQHNDGDPLYDNVAATGELSVVYFEHATRRRAKSIGNATIAADGSIDYTMTRLFGICPKYIFKRTHEPSPARVDAHPEQRDHLSEADRVQLAKSDTAWFATKGPHGADVTHRGGNTGFIHTVDDNALVIPDYFGNGMFNTLGNLALDDRLAITDVDLTTGRVLHVTGRAEAIATGLAEPSAQREVRFTVEEVRTSIAPVGTWTDVQASRYNPPIVDRPTADINPQR